MGRTWKNIRLIAKVELYYWFLRFSHTNTIINDKNLYSFVGIIFLFGVNVLDDDFMLHEFRIEAEEMFEKAEEGFLYLENGDNFKECYKKITHAFHCLVGASGMFALNDLQDQMLYLEKLLKSKENDSIMSLKQIRFFKDGIVSAKNILNLEEPDLTYITQEEFNDLSDDEGSNSVLPGLDFRKDEGIVFLLKENDSSLDSIIEKILKVGFSTKIFETDEDHVDTLEIEDSPMAVFLEIDIPSMKNAKLLQTIKEINSEIPVVLINRDSNLDIILTMINLGANNIIESSIELGLLHKILKNSKKIQFSSFLLEKCLNFIIHQYNEFEKTLSNIGDGEVSSKLKKDFEKLLEDKKKLKELKNS